MTPPQKKKKLSELFTYKLDLFSDICICFLHEIKGYKSSLEKIALINAENVCTCNTQIIQSFCKKTRSYQLLVA